MSSTPRLVLLCALLLACYSSGFVSGVMQCSDEQRSLLLKLKQGFSFPPPMCSLVFTFPPELGSWVEGSDCCLWEGITCDNTSGLVVGLDLFSAKIYSVGRIDPCLFELGSLITLDLSNTFIKSPFPPGLGQLTNLTILGLTYTHSSHQIPLEISRLTRLVSLFLSFKGFDIPKLEKPDLKTFLHNLSSLQLLHLVDIDIGREWSQIISSSLPHLRRLILNGCQLSGPIHASLLQLPFLSELDLFGNNLLSIPANSFSNSSSMRLEVLDLSECQLDIGHDQLLGKIFGLPNLHTLRLSGNKLLSQSFPSFPPYNNVSLQFLDLSRVNLNGTLPKSIFNLKFLNYLDLSSNHLTGGIPEKVGDLNFLERLDISNNHLTGGIPEKLGNLQSLGFLDLSHNSLTGRIPEKVGALSLLQYLELSYNNFTGGIPFSFGMQTNLSALGLDNNMLNGTIPSFLLNLPSLERLYLSQNLFHGSLSEITDPLSLSLNWLDLSNNNLSGAIPRSIFHLPRLEILKLSSNNFMDTIEIGLIPSVTDILDLSDNSITVKFSNESIEETPSVFGFGALRLRSCNISELPWGFLRTSQNLIQLDLSNNKIYGAIPNWTWQLWYLHYLNLSHNLLTSIEEPLNLSSSGLETLDLHANMLEGALPIPPSATFLDYSINRFASIIPANIGSYLNTTYFLSLSGNKFVGEIPPTMCKGDALQVLDMSNNSLSGLIPWCLTNMTRLSILSLSENDLHGNIPDGFVETCSLRTLALNSNRLSGPFPKSLLNCTKLEVLDLESNHLNGTFPFWLKNLSYLSVLVLRSNQFHGPIEANHIRQGFQRLQIIDLSSNSFTGTLPVEYFQSSKVMTKGGQKGSELNFLRFDEGMGPGIQLSASTYTIRLYYQDVVTLASKGHVMLFGKIITIFTLIDLSNNKFHGHMPEELGNLKFLNVLNLSQNSLSGQIPKSLGNLTSIESMDLSHNNLSGEIPIELTSLTFLEVLDLSYNKLVGRIPKGSQFSTFTNASFKGNPGLCGSPLSSNCTSTPIVQPTEGEATDDEVDRLEFMVGGILGFFCGMALVIWPLFFWTNWRKWYYNHVDKMLLCLMPKRMK